MPDTPYREVTEAEAIDAGLLEQPDTTYRRDTDGKHRAYNRGTRTYWLLGAGTLEGQEVDIGGLPHDKGPIADAIAKAQKLLVEELEAVGGRVLCAVTIVHAEGLDPSGGIDVHADEQGPQDPEDVLTFILTGTEALARRFGLPMAVFGAPVGGQG